VQVVIADTGPLQYLVLIDTIEVLPRLFSTVLLPALVRLELSHPRTPAPVRTWLAAHPAWLEPRPTPPEASLPLPQLGKGERASDRVCRADIRAKSDLLAANVARTHQQAFWYA